MDLKTKLLTASELMPETFTVFGKNLPKLFLLQLVMLGAILASFIPVIAYVLLNVDMAALGGSSPDAARELLFRLATPVFFILAGFAVIMCAVAGVWRMAAASVFLEEKLSGGNPGVIDSFKKSIPVLLPLAGTLILAGFAFYMLPALAFAGGAYFLNAEMAGAGFGFIMLGMFLFVGMAFAFVFIAPLAQVCVLKKKFFLEAVKYSYRLVKGHYWQTVVFFILVFLVMMALSIGAGVAKLIVAAVFGLLGAVLGPVLAVVFIVIVMIINVGIQLVPQCYVDVPLVMLYLNRDAVLGDKR